MPVSKINRPFAMAAAAFLAIIILSTSFTNAAPVPESLVDGVLKTVVKAGAAIVNPILPLDLDKGALEVDRKVQTGTAPLYDNNSLLGLVGSVLGTIRSTQCDDEADATEGVPRPESVGAYLGGHYAGAVTGTGRTTQRHHQAAAAHPAK
ncbi:hypothetical protein BGX30_010585 [Mortierella sp. GBA39]|nr:hypothetical protein BGX30_010585 [Mortierella sp. GBA39]